MRRSTASATLLSRGSLAIARSKGRSSSSKLLESIHVPRGEKSSGLGRPHRIRPTSSSTVIFNTPYRCLNLRSPCFPLQLQASRQNSNNSNWTANAPTSTRTRPCYSTPFRFFFSNTILQSRSRSTVADAAASNSNSNPRIDADNISSNASTTIKGTEPSNAGNENNSKHTRRTTAVAHLLYGFSITSAERQTVMRRHSIAPDDKDFEVDVNLTNAWNLHLLQNPITEEPETNPIPVIVRKKKGDHSERVIEEVGDSEKPKTEASKGEEGSDSSVTTTTTTTTKQKEGNDVVEVVIIEDSNTQSEAAEVEKQPKAEEEKKAKPEEPPKVASSSPSVTPKERPTNARREASKEEDEDEWSGLHLNNEEKLGLEREGQSFGLTFRSCGGWEEDVNAAGVAGEQIPDEEIESQQPDSSSASTDTKDDNNNKNEEERGAKRQTQVKEHKESGEEVVIITEEEVPETPRTPVKSAELAAEIEQTLHKEDIYAARKQIQESLEDREHFVAWWEETSLMGRSQELSINQLRAVVLRTKKPVEQRRLQSFFAWAGIEPRPARWVVAASTLPVEKA